MLKFMDAIDEAIGVPASSLAMEAVADADYFGVEWDPATEAVGSLGIKIGMSIRAAVTKIREWLRAMVNKVKDLFMRITKVEHGTIDAGIYKGLTKHLGELNGINYNAFVSKRGEIQKLAEPGNTAVTKKQMDVYGEIYSDLREKFDPLKDKSIDEYAAVSGTEMVVSLKSLNNEKTKLATDLKAIQDLAATLDATARVYTEKYKTVETVMKGTGDKAHEVEKTKTVSGTPTNVAPMIVNTCNVIMQLVNRKIAVINAIAAATKVAPSAKKEEK